MAGVAAGEPPLLGDVLDAQDVPGEVLVGERGDLALPGRGEHVVQEGVVAGIGGAQAGQSPQITHPRTSARPSVSPERGLSAPSSYGIKRKNLLRRRVPRTTRRGPCRARADAWPVSQVAGVEVRGFDTTSLTR